MLFRLAIVLASASLGVVVACGSSGGGGGTSTADAPGTHAIDAPGTHAIDAPASAELTGLGQKCGSGLPACPTNASDCIGAAGGPSFCSPICLTGGVGTTDGSGNFPQTGSGALVPAPNDATCTGAFTGSAGTALCGALLAYSPMDAALANNKKYTGVQFDCLVVCGTGSGSGACPATMTCDTTSGICNPM